MAKELLEQREFLRYDAKKNIETLQSENRKTYNRRRKKASLYKEGDLVAIQRTQFGAGLKLRPKFLGPYKVTKVNSKDRSVIRKVQHKWHTGHDFPVICYTDGSKIDGRVGFAFVFRSGVEFENFQFRIRDECTVFVAELLCLNFVIKWITEQNSVISE
ncbi:uncharacterized protein TNCV_2054521 [Trichonephila clavipes]|nr:uncharacterized protein TNCV_2054521 [Trichonephila clavipes]